jgi:hypothetical protein
MFFYRPTAGAGLERHLQPADVGDVRAARAQHAPMGRPPHGAVGVPAHGPRLLPRAYKPPREFNWVIGVILLTLTLLLSFTGYLLPWDQLALWAVTVGTNMMGYTPVFGTRCASCSSAARDRHETLAALVRAARADAPVRHRDLHGDPLLAGPQGRRDLGPL